MFEMRSKDYALQKVINICTEYYIAMYICYIEIYTDATEQKFTKSITKNNYLIERCVILVRYVYKYISCIFSGYTKYVGKNYNSKDLMYEDT